VTEVLGGGRFYAVEAAAGVLGRMEEALALLGQGDALAKTPTPGSFVPKRGDLVLAQFSADKSWARAMVRPLGGTPAVHALHTEYCIRGTPLYLPSCGKDCAHTKHTWCSQPGSGCPQVDT